MQFVVALYPEKQTLGLPVILDTGSFVIGFFTTSKKLYNAKLNIYLKNELLKGNKYPKYLGFILDPEIPSNKHIETICNKGRKR